MIKQKAGMSRFLLLCRTHLQLENRSQQPAHNNPVF